MYIKTLILNGSPKKNGDTEVLVNEFTKSLIGEVKIISCFSDISPCIDCRFCWANSGCSIKDEMQEVYSYLDECDNIVIASPIWFSSLSGSLLNLSSRIQTRFVARYFRNETEAMKKKNSVIILAGAEMGTEIMPTKIALTIFKFMDVDRASVQKIYSLDTNKVHASQDINALKEYLQVAEYLNIQFISSKAMLIGNHFYKGKIK